MKIESSTITIGLGQKPIDLRKFSTVFDGEAPDHLSGTHKRVLTLKSSRDEQFVISTAIGTNGFTGEPAISLNIGLTPGIPNSNGIANFNYFNIYYFGPPDTSRGDIKIIIPTLGTEHSRPSIIVGDENGGTIFDQYNYENDELRRGLSKSYDPDYLQNYSSSMLFTPDELPQSINMNKTISMFLGQINQCNFSKPVLIPR